MAIGIICVIAIIIFIVCVIFLVHKVFNTVLDEMENDFSIVENGDENG